MDDINMNDELVEREAAYNLHFLPLPGRANDRETQMARLQDYMIADRDEDAAKRVRDYYGEGVPVGAVSEKAMQYFVGAAMARNLGISGAPEAYWLGREKPEALPEVEQQDDLYTEMGRDIITKTQDAWVEQQVKLQERRQTLGTVLQQIVQEGEANKKESAAWLGFLDAQGRGVWSEDDAVSLVKATEAFSMMRGLMDDPQSAGANVLTKGSTGQLIFDALYGDEMATGLFFSALQDRIADMKTAEEERNALVQFAHAFESATKNLTAGMMGGHFRAFVTDEQVEEFNANRARHETFQAVLQGAAGADYEAAGGLSVMEDLRLQEIAHAARESGQLNADGSLRKMTDEERRSTQELNEFRGQLHNAVQGVYDIGGLAKFGKMMPGSLAYLVPGGMLASAMSMRTHDLASQLGEGSDWVSANARATVNAAIQAGVEKMAFGSIKATKMAPGLDALMSTGPMARVFGKLYGTTAGRIGMGVVAGGLEETFAEPAAGLLLSGIYNAFAPTGLELDSPWVEYKNEMAEMLKPDQILATALYGLLLGGVNVPGHRAEAKHYKKVVEGLERIGIDHNVAANMARSDGSLQQIAAGVQQVDAALKKDAGSVFGYIAELYPQLQEISAFENLMRAYNLPKMLPGEGGNVRVQYKDEDGKVQELVMSQEAGRLFVQARIEQLGSKVQVGFADMVLGQVMTGKVAEKSDSWVVSVEDADMNADYFRRIAAAAGIRLSQGAKATDIAPEIHPYIPLGTLAQQGRAWESRMRVARGEAEEKLGRKLTDEEWAQREKQLVSRVNRVRVASQDGRVRTVLRVARGGYGAMEVLEDVTEDFLSLDMEENGRELGWYADNLLELERALGRRGAFLHELKEGESYDRMAIIEGVGKLVQSKVLADTTKKYKLGEKLNAFLDMIRHLVQRAVAMLKLGKAINKVLADKEASAKLDPEFVGMVDRLVEKDVEFLRELQLEDGLAAMQRVLEQRVPSTPVLAEAEAKHGEQVREEAAAKAAAQRAVDADVAEGEAAVEGSMSAVNQEELDYLSDKDGNLVSIQTIVQRVRENNNARLAEAMQEERYSSVIAQISAALAGEIQGAISYRNLNQKEIEMLSPVLGVDLSGYEWRFIGTDLRKALNLRKQNKYSYKLDETDIKLLPVWIDEIATATDLGKTANVKKDDNTDTFEVTLEDPMSGIRLQFQISSKTAKLNRYKNPKKEKRPSINLRSCRAFILKSAGLAPARPLESAPSSGGTLPESAEEVKLNLLRQEFTSRNTSINSTKAPAIFKAVEEDGDGWKSGSVNIDIGGGKFDTLTQALADKGVKSYIYEPYGRTANENAYVLAQLQSKMLQGDTATCSNVLNVIKESEIRANVVHQVAKAIKPDGVAYFTIYEGKGNGVGAVSKDDCWQNNRKTATYVDEVRQHFGDVQLKKKLIIAREPLHRDVPAQWLLEKDGEVMSFSVAEAEEAGLFDGGMLEAGNAVVTAPSFSIEALHATPHRFRKFDTSKMGTGEGAQAFGWGLYFSGDRGSNEFYYNKFNRRTVYFKKNEEISHVQFLKEIEEAMKKHGGWTLDLAFSSNTFVGLSNGRSLKQLLAAAKRRKNISAESLTQYKDALDELSVRGLEAVNGGNAANLRVELNADDSNLLMWDEKVPAELHEAVRELRSGQPVKGLVISMPNASEMTWPGYRIYRELINALGSAKAASEWLAERGYKGIKYLDGMSRRNGEGTYNYVIFSGDDVKVTGVNETGEFNSPWEDYEDETASFSVVGEGAANWDEIKHLAFRGRDDGKLRVELDASQAKLRKTKRHAMDDSVVEELLSRVEWFAAHVRAAGRWDDTLDAWKKGYWGYTVRELAFLSRVLKSVGLEFSSFKAMEKAGVFELVMNPGVETAKQVLKKRKVKNVLGYNKLGEVLDFPAVYEAYPELKEVPVYWMNDKFQYRAAYTVSGEHRRQRISARANRAEGGILSSLLHEVQHWIQAKEGFAWGAVPGEDDSYERSAGEIEARNVQRRRWMDAEERALLPFNETLTHSGESRAYTLEEAMASMSVAEREIEEYRDNTIEFNVVSAQDKEARDYQAAQMRAKGMTAAEIADYFTLLDNMVSDVLEVSKGVPEFKEWQEEALLRYEHKVRGVPRLSPNVSSLKKNGDYPVNFDLGTICVKREMMTLLTDKLIAMGYADRLGVSQIEQLKDLMREAGIATACDICFVEARRVRALQQSQALAFYWNAVRAAAGIEDDAGIFNNGKLTEPQIKKLQKMAANDKTQRAKALQELVADEYRRNEKLDKGLSPKTMAMIATVFLQDHSLAGAATLGDFMSATTVDKMLRHYPHTAIRQLLASAFGPSTAKPVEKFNVYDALSLRDHGKDRTLKQHMETLYGIGGGRLQSFSDFNPILFMDYYQLMFDFAWRGWPLQTYTKVPSFVELFGLTGVKINMSLVPDVLDEVDVQHAGLMQDENGNWVYAWHRDSFPVNLAFQYRERDGLHQNVGIVAVAISDEHLRMLLRDERIDYVIPYHRSGMPNSMLIKTGLEKARDYSDVQNTRKPGADKYKDKYKFNEVLRKLKDPKAAAKAYLEYCDKKGLIPKFDEFRDEENYYKLLVDFRVYDRDGLYAPQGPVTTTMPENWGEVLDKALGDRVAEQKKMERYLEDERFMRKAEAIMEQTPLEFETREMLVKRLNAALRTKAVPEPVETLRASEFDKKVYELCCQTMNAEDSAKFHELLRLRNGVIYGFTHKGKLYLKENTFNANTPAHEFAHVWAKVAQRVNPELWAEGVELLKKTVHWGDVLTDPLYFNIHDNENAVASEVLARVVGLQSDTMIRELTDPTKKALTEVGLAKKIGAWIAKLFEAVRSIFDAPGGKPLTLAEFGKMPLKDLWDDTRTPMFNKYVREHLSKTPEELQAELSASMSMVDLSEEGIAHDIAAAGYGFRANREFAEQMMREIRASLVRMKKLGSKTRTDREDALAAMGGITHMVRALVQYLPRGYRFAVHPYMSRLEVLTELATTGNVEMLRENVSKGLQAWMDETSETWHEVLPQLSGNENMTREELTARVQEMMKEHAGQQLTEAVERIVERVAGQLRKYAKDTAVTRMRELLERVQPKKDPKSGKVKGGKMSADDYRDLKDVQAALDMNAEKLEAKMAALKAEMEKPGLSEEKRDEKEALLMLYDQFGDPDSMSAEEAVAAYEALRQRIWMSRFEWENIQSEKRAARRAVVRRIVEGVGSVSENEYNAKKRRVKPTKRMKNLGDVLAGMPAAVGALRGYLPLREMADSLTRRANRAGELIKEWEAERWIALETLSKQTLGKSWRLSMDYMHKVLPTGVAFERPVYRTVDIKVPALRELLQMDAKARVAEMKRRREAGGKEAETALSERDIEAAAKELERMDEAGVVKGWVHARYLKELRREENLQLSRGEALYAILMYEQPTYTERMEAQGYTPEVVAGLKKFIGDGMLEFGYGLRELFRIQGDKIAAIYEREFGVPFPREENYFAARWDVTEMKENPAEQLLAGMAGTPGAGNGWMKTRVNHELELDMTKDALQVFLQATTLTDTWMATQDIVADFKAWTRDKDFARALTALLGEESYTNLKDWIRILEQGGAQDCLNMGVTQDVINGLYGSGAVAILGLRVQTLIRQVPSVFNGMLGSSDITAGEWFATLARMKHGDAPMTFKRMKDSVLMKNRRQGRAGNMASQAVRSGDTDSSVTEEFLLASMLPMEWMDASCTAMSLVPVWNVYYDRAVRKGANHQEAEQAAWEQTTVVANLASQPIGWLNKSKIAQSRNPIVKSMFYMLSENTAKFALCRALWKGRNKKAAVRAWLVYGAANAAISALLDCLQGDPDEWEKGEWWEYMLSALYGPAASLPGVGEALEALGTLVLNVTGHALDIESLQKAKARASVGRALIDVGGTWRAMQKLYEFMTDDKEHTLVEYTRAASTVSRTLAIGTGWMGNMVGYWSTALAVLTNPVDFVARVYRNMKQYYGKE